MSSNYPELVFNESEDFTAERLNKAMQVLDQRLRSLEPFAPSWEAAVNDLRAVGLSRLNDAILPSYQRIQLLSELGFLFAGSSSSVTLVQNQSVTFTIDSEVERSLFTPTPFLAITRTSTLSDYAIAQLVSYEKSTGRLMLLVKAITGNPGPFTDWQIGALAANTAAAMAYFTQIDAARVAAVAAQVKSTADAVATAADRIQTGADRLAVVQLKDAAAASAENAKLWDPTGYATTLYVDGKISGLVNGAGVALDTLKELADALGNDANYSATVSASLGNRLRVDTATQGLNATQQGNGRTNLGLGAASVKGVASAANLLAKSGSDVITTDQAWAAAGWVALGNKSGAVTIDANTGSKFYLIATGPVTIGVSNLNNGQDVVVCVVQDPTGGRTVGWSGVIAWPSNTVPAVATVANGVAVIAVLEGSWNPASLVFGTGWKVS